MDGLASVGKRDETTSRGSEPPPPYQPPAYSETSAATPGGYWASTPVSPTAGPSDVTTTSYGYGFTTAVPFVGSRDVQQSSNFRYQPLENETAGDWGQPYQPHHHQAQTVIVQQPARENVVWGHDVVQSAPLADPPDDYMCYSVFVTLCCCWMIGMLAIIRSSECRAAIAAGDRITAETKSREARLKANLALILGIISTVVAGVIIGLRFGLQFNSL